MEGKISVIVPIYNQERYLNKSISSIINQKYTNLEIILINDGSTDSSIEIIDDFALKDSRIRVFSKPNGGLVDATIYGINQATGEYIAFLDPDDYIGPLYLWDLLSQMDDDIDFVASGFYRNNNGQFIPVILSEDSKIVGDQFQKLRDHYLLDGKIDFSDKIFISRWNKLYRANVVKTVAAPFFNYREVTLGEDSIFTYLMLSHSRGCKTIKGPKDYFYNVGNQNSMMVSNTIERHMEKSKLAYNSLKNLLINEGLSTKQAYALYFFEVESVFERLMKNDFEQFRKLYYHLRKDEVYTTSLKLFRDLSYSAKTWIRIFGRLYFPAFLYSYIRLKLKSDLRTIKLFLGNTRFILKYLVKNGLVKTHYQIKFRRRRDNNFKEINKFLPIIDSRVKEIITSYTGGKTELNECPVCNNIFLFWWDGFDTAPELVKACTETVYKYYPDYYYIVNAIVGVMNVITSAMIGGIGNSIAAESKKKNYNDFTVFNFIYMWISSWATVTLFSLYQNFMVLWVGEKLTLPLLAPVLFSIYFYALKMCDIRTTYTSAAGLWWENRLRAICETVANIILNYILVRIWGVYGIVLATIIPLVLINFGFGAQVLFKHYFTEEKISKYFIDNLSYAVVTIISAIVTFKVTTFIGEYTVVNLFIRGIVCCILPNILLWIAYFRTLKFKMAKEWVLTKIKRRH